MYLSVLKPHTKKYNIIQKFIAPADDNFCVSQKDGQTHTHLLAFDM